MASQNQYLLEYLQKGNTITAYEASTQHGIMQLGRCISDLEAEGHVIKRRWTQVSTRHGEGTTRAKEYWLKDAEQQGDMFGGKPKPKSKNAQML